MRASLLLLSCILFFHRKLCGVISLSDPTSSPPRGWNSYDSFSWIVDEQAFLDNAVFLAKNLYQHGYEYVVVDFLWYRKNVDGASEDSYGFDYIDQWGRPFPDPDRWPSSRGGKGFAEVARKVHEMGLKFGIHVMRGINKQAVDSGTPILDVLKNSTYVEGNRTWTAKDIGITWRTCAWMQHGFMSVNTDIAAGRAFLRSLYQQYAEWGVDFVKLDCVFGEDLDTKEIIAVSELLRELDRPVLFSLSPGTSVTPSMAGPISSYVDMYRITADDWDKWTDVASHFDISRDFAAANLIGTKGLHGKSWPDLDMLPLGWITDPGVREGPHRKSNLTLDEQKTQVTLWSMAKSPLMFGGDLRNIDRTTLSLITNPTLLDINSFSANNKEFPFIFATRDIKSRYRPLNNRLTSQNLMVKPDKKVLGFTSCESVKAKGWFTKKDERDLNHICWRSDSTSQNPPYCLHNRIPNLTQDQLIIHKEEHVRLFQLVTKQTPDTCVATSISRKRTALEKERTTSSICTTHAAQMWGLNNNGTLVNSYSGLCATMISEKDNTIEGVRSWIATGRRGEVYMSFFNLNPQTTVISARTSDIAKLPAVIISLLLHFAATTTASGPCKFPAIFNFGDSNSDTGGLSAAFGPVPPPNGETFFVKPAGRYSDGRLMIDFMANTLGIPYLSAYLDSMGSNFSQGANFATAGSTIRRPNTTWFQTGYSPFSLDVQTWQFSQLISRSQSFQDQGLLKDKFPKEEDLSQALYTFDIGQNDLTAAYFSNMTSEEVKAVVPNIIDEFTTAIKNVYGKGGRFFWIHNTGPVGCLAYVLDRLTLRAPEVDRVGCGSPFNEVARFFNTKLNETVNQLRKDLPLAVFTYVDVYSLKYELISHASKHGFELPLVSCCGHGGKYNFNIHHMCGSKITVNGTEVVIGKSCKNPSKRIVWDGIHYTEAANKWVFDRIVGGKFSFPPTPLRMACKKTVN
ncbi:hypothetical protein Cni_G23158 [Canna indica]|uniref:Alpha-galactosidase n=1 Tax=Canna indica TaxID=4628 RepID=A0AAQ3KWL9_9LILI|nr:hypothetical protein Cni_G23158 [Canna indica]